MKALLNLKLCNRNCVKNIPKIYWLLTAIISVTVIGLIAHGLVKLTQTLHEETIEKDNKLKDFKAKSNFEMKTNLKEKKIENKEEESKL